jgi:cell fate regulator YaaT (PSP1 superfamily)
MNLVGVRFSKAGKIYHFDASEYPDLVVGEAVIVETSRGCQIGQVAQILGETTEKEAGSVKKIDRRATPRDLVLRQAYSQKENEIINFCRERVIQLGISGIKISSAEYSFDGTKLSVMFCSDTEEKTDLKSLRQDVQKRFPGAQVELRQIGPRDVAKTMCGMGACGLESRCCSRFLTDFSSISIKMAKEQDISLTPTEITGMCGRLRCCLNYEYEQYTEARKQLPKKNKMVKTPLGEGKVVGINALMGMVIVELPEVGQKIFSKADIHYTEG